ncbi:MAG: lipopolysaccharide heptosyltransferase II [Planctomycetes bacterium]|nr:lipopolysaccharide heptosyltransferase II [Planctomycetota bacterium]
MKLAIFLPNWIGDVVMATPALRAVRDQFPAAEIVGIMRPYVADVLTGTGLLDRHLYYNPRGKTPEQRGWTFLRQLRAEQFDTTLLLTNSLRTGVLAWMSGAGRRVGFARDWRGWLLTDRVTPYSRSVPNPVMDEYLRLAERLGCTSRPTALELAVALQDLAQLDQFWSTVPSARRDAYVCLNTGGAFGAAKNWPRDKFVELARRITTELNKTVLVVCGPSERDDARWIAEAANDPAIVSLADAKLSLGLTKAAIRESELLVTTDSGPRHFAAAFGVPVITLYGPTHIAWSDTRYEMGENLQLKLDCGPCQQRECPLKHHRCMQDLSVDTVFAAVRRQLSRYPSRRHVA